MILGIEQWEGTGIEPVDVELECTRTVLKHVYLAGASFFEISGEGAFKEVGGRAE